MRVYVCALMESCCDRAQLQSLSMLLDGETNLSKNAWLRVESQQVHSAPLRLRVFVMAPVLAPDLADVMCLSPLSIRMAEWCDLNPAGLDNGHVDASLK